MAEINDDTPLKLSQEVTKLVYEIAKEENFKSVHLDVTEATAKGDNYMGNVLRVKITDDNHDKSINLIVKNALDSKALREHCPVASFYKMETFAYSKLLPTLCELQEKHRLPEKDKFKYARYYGSVMVEMKESVLMEDLNVKGYTLYNRQVPFDQQHLELVVTTMARYHALSFVLKNIDPKLFEYFSKTVPRTVAVYGYNVEKMVKVCKKMCVKIIEDSELRRRADEFFGDDAYETFGRFVDAEKTEPYNVICHGDCWSNNFMFRYEADRVVEMRFVDWQIVRCASPITDMGYSIFSSTDEKMRANHYSNLLDLYYETLTNNVTLMGCKISECYPRNVYEDQIKAIMPFGLIAATLLLPLILANKEDSFDILEDPNEIDETTHENLMSKLCRDRYNGVIRDSFSYGFI